MVLPPLIRVPYGRSDDGVEEDVGAAQLTDDELGAAVAKQLSISPQP